MRRDNNKLHLDIWNYILAILRYCKENLSTELTTNDEGKAKERIYFHNVSFTLWHIFRKYRHHNMKFEELTWARILGIGIRA